MQYVHSKLQIIALLEFGGSVLSQCSQLGLSSSISTSRSVKVRSGHDRKGWRTMGNIFGDEPAWISPINSKPWRS